MIAALATNLFCNGVSAAEAKNCQAANARAEAAGDNFIPPVEARITEGGRAQFYSAPEPSCEMKGVFLIPNDYVFGHVSYKGWTQVMFVNEKTGKDTQGWIKNDRLKVSGQLGGKKD